MVLDPATLQKDPDHLLGVISELVNRVNKLERLNGWLEEQNRALFRKLFGRSSEKLNPGQFELVFEAMLDMGIAQAEVEQIELEEAPRRRKGSGKPSGRRPLPEHLPRERHEEPIPEALRRCGTCGCERERIGEEVSEMLDYTPASLKVIENVRAVLACKNPECEGTISRAPVVAKPIEKGLAGPGLLAHVVVSKYLDHLPLHRQSRIFERQGVDISRTTMCTWIAQVADLVTPLYEWMVEDLRLSRIIHTDDTVIPVLDEEGGPAKKGRLWVYIGDRAHPQIVFDYTPTRKRDGPARFLCDFSGYLQADAYSGYDGIYAGGSIKEVACWAHTRRYFFNAADGNGDSRAYPGLAYIKQLFTIEDAAKDLSPADRLALRREKSIEVLDAMKLWLDEQKQSALPKSSFGAAVGYTLNQWDALRRFTDDGELSIDNNAAERQLRAVAVGRKNWLFAGSDAGAVRAAKLYTLIASARRHDIEPFAYLRELFTLLPKHPASRIGELAPSRWRHRAAAENPTG